METSTLENVHANPRIPNDTLRVPRSSSRMLLQIEEEKISDMRIQILDAEEPSLASYISKELSKILNTSEKAVPESRTTFQS